MNQEFKRVLELVQEKKITPLEGRRHLEKIRGRAGAENIKSDLTRSGPLKNNVIGFSTETRKKIAIIGLSCRFAGAQSAQELWRNLESGVNSIREVPADRWNSARYYDSDPRTPGKSNSRWGGFIDGVYDFDPLFFNMSGKEAELTDPQQRLFLEDCWRAMEDAGYVGSQTSSLNCGVFAGVPSSDYENEINKAGVDRDAQTLMGNDSAILPARISYLLNLKGPSIGINTACSSSLVAIHLASQAIESGQCDMAIAGGACLFVTPNFYVSSSKAGMLSPDGQCKTFDQDANGFVPGDGVGVVVLKDLEAAVRDQDHIYGVILGVDTNQDGKTNGITAPSSRSQTAVQLSTYRNAGVNPETITLIEAHGTGTPLGDPIEIEALTRSFSEYTDRKQFCAIGSIKTNLGHTGQAAGVAGLIKVLLSFEHEKIPPTLNFKEANRRLKFEETPFYVATEAKSWPRVPGSPRRGAVSSFGYSGTNAHIVVEEPPLSQLQDDIQPGDEQLVLISAKTRTALGEKLKDLEAWLDEDGKDQTTRDLAFTLHAGRKHFSERIAFVVKDNQELRSEISQLRDSKKEAEERLSPAEKQEWSERLRMEFSRAYSQIETRHSFLETLAELYMKGLDIDVDLLYPEGKGRRISMPTYAFDLDSYRIGAVGISSEERAEQSVSVKSLLTVDSSVPGKQQFNFKARGDEFFIADHVIHNKKVIAGAVLLELASEVAALALPNKLTSIRDIVWRSPLTIDNECALSVQLNTLDSNVSFNIDQTGRSGQLPSVEGVLVCEGEVDNETAIDISAIRRRCENKLSGKDCYARFKEIGFEYGPGFRSISELEFNDTEVLAKLELPEKQAADLESFSLHPTLLDGALQSLIGLAGLDDETSELFMPAAMKEISFNGHFCQKCFAYLVRLDSETFDIQLVDETGKLIVSLHGLRVAKVVPAASKNLFFRPRWKQSPLASNDISFSNTLVLDFDNVLGTKLDSAQLGGTVTISKPGAQFVKIDDRHYEVDFRKPASYENLIGNFLKGKSQKGINIVCIANDDLLNSKQYEDFTVGFDSLLYLTQTLMNHRLGENVKLGYIYPLHEDGALPNHSAVGAFSKTLKLENPDYHLHVMGVPTDTVGEVKIVEHWNNIINELHSTSDNLEARYGDDGQRWIKKYEELSMPRSNESINLRKDGVYIVTGGMGRISQHLAQRLKQSNINLVLVGRSELSADKQNDLAVLSTDTANVYYEQVDITDRIELEKLIQQIRSRFGAIHGIIHTAGVLRDSFILHKTPEEVREVLAAKVYGTTLLDELTCNDKLDFVVYFSSVVSVLGNVGSSDYAFANAYLDEFAAMRESLRKKGERWGKTISINWPAWMDGGMNSLAEEERKREGAGIHPLRSDEGFNIFKDALESDESQLIVFKGMAASIRSLFNELPDKQDIANQISSAEANDLQPKAEMYLRGILAEELRVPIERIDVSEPLETYGIDSTMVMSLSQRLESDFGELPKTLFFEYQNLRDLSSYFVERHAERLREKLGLRSEKIIDLPVTTNTKRKNNLSVVSEDLVSHPVSDTPEDLEAIAIVGLSGRYPMADDLDTFWKNLVEGRDCISEIPPERWAIDDFYDPEHGKAGKSYSKWGGFLEDIDKFDPMFFKIAPREADMIDPQERLFLETVWHVLEDAGYTRKALSNKTTGVFVGVMYSEYQLYGDAASDGRMGVSSFASIANRISYFFNFHGPSIALDTMCSSSLTAIHLACESIRRGECEVAVAGGVNLSLHPKKYLQLSLQRFASTDGRCRSFGEGGDGYVPGEGVGAVLLKPLASAIADGDNIQAIIRGSAINHGGKTNGYTVPNPVSQSHVISDALRNAKIGPEQLSYIEAHGTGTALGDPIEITALSKAFKGLKRDNEWCPVGSVKSSIGHLESAAGIAAITKVVLQMKHRTLVPSLHASQLNPNIGFAESPLRVQREVSQWNQPKIIKEGKAKISPRIAGVSSFGAGGSNAHVIIEEYDVHPAFSDEYNTNGLNANPQLIVLSARTPEQLVLLAKSIAKHFSSYSDGQSVSQPGQWKDKLQNDIHERVCQFLGVQKEDVGKEDNLYECGLDEVTVTQLLTNISEAYQLQELEMTHLAEFTSIATIAEFLIYSSEKELRSHFVSEEIADVVVPLLDQPRLDDVAVTLQAGREEMPERLAFIASELPVVINKLNSFAKGDVVEAGIYAGRVQVEHDHSQLTVFDGQSGQQYLRALISEGNLERIAQLWVQGAIIDWNLLHTGHRPKRISLPGYPFARERHWLSPSKEQRYSPTPSEQNIIREEINTETSSSDEYIDIHQHVVHDLVSMAAGIIGLEPKRIDPKVNFGEYGFESVSLTELSKKIAERFTVEVAPTLFFERPSIDRVASWLIDEYESQVETIYAPRAEQTAHDKKQKFVNEYAVSKQEKHDSPISSNEPIAIIGMSGKFPGSKDLKQFWENLCAERNLVTEIPKERWDWREFDNENIADEQRSKSHWGGFIDDVDKFDPLFFGISPIEAEMMDPQQRVFLEVVWAAIEDAGYRPSAFSGKNVGLFAGVQFSDYQHLLHDAGILTAQSGLGNEHSIVLNRVSYLLNLSGPSEPVNTACSSSLVAVHRAVRSLRQGESSVAIAGGIALNLAPYSTEAAGKMGLLSPDGKCKTLDRKANGYVKGEGVGVVLLKPLSKAISDGDHIYATIRGTSVNHGGRAASLTAPNSEAQASLIKQAADEAGVGPETIGYMELHGTGTELGDPVEVNGIKSAFKQLAKGRETSLPDQPYCGIGSVKTNIGHLEPASGIAGMIKIILSMQHKTLPGILHLEEVNPYVDLKNSPFFIVDKTTPWERLEGAEGSESLPLRAGVSSFGFGGVNAHVLLDEYLSPEGAGEPEALTDQIFVFSAKTEHALKAITKTFIDHIASWEQTESPNLIDVAYTLQLGRDEMKYRLACVAKDIQELRGGLENYINDVVGNSRLFKGEISEEVSTDIDSRDLLKLADHWVKGGIVDWAQFYQNSTPKRVSLPSYAFERTRYWYSAPEGVVGFRRHQPELTASNTGTQSVEHGNADLDVYTELKQIFVDKLKLDEDKIGDDTNFQEFGVDSMFSAIIMQEIQGRFGAQIPLTALMENPTLRQLSNFISKEFFEGDTSDKIVPIRNRKEKVVAEQKNALPPELLPINIKGSQQTSFWVHGATGYSMWFQNLADALGPDYPIYAFQARGTDGSAMPQMLDEMVDHYVNCIRMVQPKGPYVIGGYSFGGLIAMEMARRLHAEGETIKHLIMFDTYPATQEVFDRHFGPYDTDFLPLYLANYVLKINENPELIITKDDIKDLPKRLQLAKLASLVKERGQGLMSKEDIFRYLRGALLCSEFSEGMYQTYKPEPYEASDVLFFRATDGFTGRASLAYWPRTDILDGYDYIQPWREVVQGNIDVVELDNDHLNMLEEPSLSVATQQIEMLLKAPEPLDEEQYRAFNTAFNEVTQFGHQLLAHRFHDALASSNADMRFSKQELYDHLKVIPQYERLFNSFVDILQHEDYLQNKDGQLAFTSKYSELPFKNKEQISARSEELAATYPEIKDYLPLLIACQGAVIDIIDGKQDPIEIVFPGGSMNLVAELYKGNLQTDYYNRLVGSQVESYIRQQSRRYKHAMIQVFEIGAGTGCTSQFIFAALREHEQRLRYLFTDIGSAFVHSSKAQFAEKYPYTDYLVFDVEKPLEAQGVEPGTSDVVIASNVLHTTRRISVTLENCRSLLKPGGMIVINELTRRLDYNTLTFGLTPGWWFFEDEEVRIDGSPILLNERWMQVLEEAGFSDVRIHGVPFVDTKDLPQSVITARKV